MCHNRPRSAWRRPLAGSRRAWRTVPGNTHALPGPSHEARRAEARARAQVKLHAWFAGLDWANLARTKAAFIPALDSPTDTAYFAPKPVRVAPCSTPCRVSAFCCDFLDMLTAELVKWAACLRPQICLDFARCARLPQVPVCRYAGHVKRQHAGHKLCCRERERRASPARAGRQVSVASMAMDIQSSDELGSSRPESPAGSAAASGCFRGGGGALGRPRSRPRSGGRAGSLRAGSDAASAASSSPATPLQSPGARALCCRVG